MQCNCSAIALQVQLQGCNAIAGMGIGNPKGRKLTSRLQYVLRRADASCSSIHLPCIAVYDLCKVRLMGSKCHDTSEQHRAKPAQIKTQDCLACGVKMTQESIRVSICDCQVPETQRQSSGLGPPGFRLRAPVLGPVERREISLTCFNRNSTEHCALTKDAVNRTQVGQHISGCSWSRACRCLVHRACRHLHPRL